jgi:predicted chitinase
MLVQRLLNQHRQPPLRRIDENGVMGPDTIAAIEEFQRRVVKMKSPDGRVDPGGATLRALSEHAHGASTSAPKTLAEALAQHGVRSPAAQANANAVLQALKDSGITSKRAQANILAQVNAECGFVPRTEGNYSAATLLKLYGPDQTRNKVRFQTLKDAQAVVDQGHEAVFEKIYGGRMGNNAAGEGYKYRGRGYIQLTGKDNYSRVGTAIKEDLVGNPDLANDPKVATKVLLNFLGINAANQAHFENIDKVNAKVGPAASPASRATFAEAILKFL